MKSYGMKRELGPPICSMCVCNRPANGWEAVHNLIGAFLLPRKCARCRVSLCKWRDTSEIENALGWTLDQLKGAFSTSAQLILQIVLAN